MFIIITSSIFIRYHKYTLYPFSCQCFFRFLRYFYSIS
nr:MAG TPA: hypothetical protein [Caudoviricetes sp.]